MQISDHRQYKPKPGVSYVGHSVDKKFVHIWERDNNTGERRRVSFNIRPYCYMHDPIEYRQNPESYVYESIYGDKAEKIEFRNMAALKNFKKEIEFENLKRSKQTRITLFESDFSPLDRVLMDCYYGATTPKLNYVFLDIETDYDPSKPFSAPTYHPGTNVPNEKVMYAPINAVALYRSWSKDYVTIAVPPKGWVGDLGEELDLSELGDGSTVKSKFIMVADEVELLKTFLRETANADVYSGWNSEFFDMPYMTMRTKILEEQGKGISIADWSLEYANEIRFTEQESFGEKRPKADFDPTGFNHLDYLLCLKKFTFGSRPSYKLASIAEDELKIPKLDYEGSLADLYKNDFKRFVQYNTRDVEIVVKLDEKFSFMSLAVQLSHANTTNLGAVMGTVRYVETGITNFAHRIMKKIVNDKIAHTPGPKVEGAIVLSPKIGLHEWIASVDIQSLYPNILQSINGSPEKMIGQFLDGEKVWRAIRNKQYDVPCSLVLNGEEDSEAHMMSAGEWAALFVKEKWCLTAYGTVFDQSNGKGLLTIVIETWFAERKALKAELSKWEKKEAELERAGITSGKEWDHVQHQIAHYDLLQLTKKIQLNSTYGALLNEHFRYYRLEIGASITASGRQVTTHMIGTIGEIIVGEFSFLTSKLEHRPDGSVGKLYFTDAKSPVHYSDTDSQHGGAILRTSLGVMTFEETFSKADFVIVDKGRELAQFTEPLRVLSYDPESEKVEMKEVDMIYRHRVTKERFDIELENGFKTSVTGDHSLMVERNGKLIEIKARDIQDDDIFITINDNK